MDSGIIIFLSFISALIVKDFYDIFISNHIREFFKKYKMELIPYDKHRKIKKKNNKKSKS